MTRSNGLFEVTFYLTVSGDTEDIATFFRRVQETV